MSAGLEVNDIAIKHVYNIGNSSCSYTDLEFGVETQLGALGYLLGKENEGIKGIKYHVHFNNIQTGWNAISCSLSAYYHSLSYSHDPQPLEILKNIPIAFHKKLTKEQSEFPDDGHVYVTMSTDVPVLAIKSELEQEYHDDQNLISDGKQIKRPLLARPDIKLLLLAQKAYSEGGLALCTYATHIQDIIDNDNNRQPNDTELLYLNEILSPIVKSYCTKYSLISIDYAKQIFDGIGVVEGNITTDLYKYVNNIYYLLLLFFLF